MAGSTAGKGDRATIPSDNPNTEESAAANIEIPLAWLREAERAKKIDRNSRVIFPLLFLAFNLGYWIYYQVLC